MLVATSGYTYSKETAYNDVRVRSGEKLVRLNVRNEVSALFRFPQCDLPACAANVWYLSKGFMVSLWSPGHYRSGLTSVSALLCFRHACGIVISPFLASCAQDFSTVLAAIRSHPGYVKVKLEFQRCER